MIFFNIQTPDIIHLISNIFIFRPKPPQEFSHSPKRGISEREERSDKIRPSSVHAMPCLPFNRAPLCLATITPSFNMQYSRHRFLATREICPMRANYQQHSLDLATGLPTGNGEKLSISHAEPGLAINSAVASISCWAFCSQTRYNSYNRVFLVDFL